MESVTESQITLNKIVYKLTKMKKKQAKQTKEI